MKRQDPRGKKSLSVDPLTSLPVGVGHHAVHPSHSLQLTSGEDSRMLDSTSSLFTCCACFVFVFVFAIVVMLCFVFTVCYFVVCVVIRCLFCCHQIFVLLSSDVCFVVIVCFVIRCQFCC